MKKTIIFLLVAALILVSFQFGEAQQASGKIPRIGYLAKKRRGDPHRDL